MQTITFGTADIDQPTTPMPPPTRPLAPLTFSAADIDTAPPDFTTSNLKDASGEATVDPNTLGTYVKHLWANINPVAIGQMLPFPKVAGGSGWDNPLNPRKMAQDLYAVKQQATAAMDKGDYATAFAKYVESVIPVLGPILSQQGNQLVQGKYAAAAGSMTGLAVNAALPAAVGELRMPTQVGFGMKPANPAEAAAVQFGKDRGIPQDAATATGNRFVRGVQALTEHSPIGSVIAERGKAAQQAGLARVGGELAADAHPTPVTSEQAGGAVTAGLRNQVRAANVDASAAYDIVRKIEADPARAASMQVDLQPARAGLRTIYERLKREAELVPLQGDKARALTALDRLLSGDKAPVPLSIVDEALGDLKSLARTDVPELRTQGQGIAAQAVRQLEAQVQATARRAGPDAIQALQQGRAATVTKYQRAGVLEDVAGADAALEPVKVMRRLTAAKDSAIDLLRRTQAVTPREIPQIARAYLDDLLGHATSEGGFGHAAKLAADWERLGDATKEILFPGAQTKALDNFFLLAKKMAESPNPSGTALTLGSGSHFALILTNPLTGIPVTLGSGAVAGLLRSPVGVAALTRAVQLSTKGAQVSGAARTAAVLNLVNAAREAGVLDLPKAAGQPQGQPQTEAKPPGGPISRRDEVGPQQPTNAFGQTLPLAAHQDYLGMAMDALRGLTVGTADQKDSTIAKAATVLAAALPMIGGAKALKAAVSAELALREEGAVQGIRAFHGSPHDFEKFSTAKIGTGEGAQAYGHGLYFAEKEGTARAYRDNFQSFKDAAVKTSAGETLAVPTWVQNRMDAGEVDSVIADFSGRLKEMRETQAQHAQPWLVDEMIAGSERILKAARAFKAGEATTIPAAHMYEVNIKAHPEQFLDWDKPLSQQSETVQQAFRDLNAADHFGYSLPEFKRLPAAKQAELLARAPSVTDNNLTGAQLYERLQNEVMFGEHPSQLGRSGNDRGAAAVGASDLLKKHDVAGIKYLDQGSRTTGKGTSNYVVFDDALVDILKKYGIAGGVIGAIQHQMALNRRRPAVGSQ